MGFESVKLARLIELDYEAPAAAFLTISTDLPGDAIGVREIETIPPSSTRRTVVLRLSGTTKGRLWKFSITANGAFRLYGLRIYTRALGRTASNWAWHAIPVVPTPDAWTEIRLPIAPTPDDWTRIRLPIDPTPDDWSKASLPIEETPDLLRWAEIPVDQ